VALPCNCNPVNDVAVTVVLVSVAEKSFIVDTFIVYDVALSTCVQLNVGMDDMLDELFGGYSRVTGTSGTAVVNVLVAAQLLNVAEL
jgi:hypothetical protein